MRIKTKDEWMWLYKLSPRFVRMLKRRVVAGQSLEPVLDRLRWHGVSASHLALVARVGKAMARPINSNTKYKKIRMDSGPFAR
jgi:hypothetical protein